MPQHRDLYPAQDKNLLGVSTALRIKTVSEELRVVFDDGKVAETSKGLWLFEMGYPPVYYFPAEGVDVDFLLSIYGDKVCEYLGLIRLWKIEKFGICLECAAWSGPDPAEVYRKIKGY